MSSQGNRLPDDPNVKVPSAVLRASAAADAIHKKAYEPGSTPPAAAPAPEPAAAPAPAPSAFATPAPAPAPVPETGGVDSWENRFKASEGRLRRANETISQQQQTISSLEGRLGNVEGMLARINANPAPAAAPAPAPRELDPKSLVTPEEVQAYGPEFMDVVGRVAMQKFEGERASLLGEIDGLKRQLGGVTQHVVGDARERMFQKMDATLPTWREVNVDPKFLAWLRLTDSYSGAIRGELLKQAFAQNNADRLLAFFKGFLAEEATVAPATPSAPASDGRPSLEDLAAPGRAKSEAVTQQGNPSEKPTISRAQIAQFYRDVQSGKYRGRDTEKASAEAEIFAAEREGRIR